MTENRVEGAGSAGAGRPVPTKAEARPDGEGAGPLVVPGGDGAALDPRGEEELWVGRTHWKHYAGRLILWLAANVAVAVLAALAASRFEWLSAAGACWVVAAVLFLSGIVVVGRVVLIIVGRRYRVTSQRLFIENGILSQTVDQTELIRVDDVRIHKSLLDRILGIGTVSILSTDSSDREVTLIGEARPEQVAEAIRKNMRSLRQKSLFVENL